MLQRRSGVLRSWMRGRLGYHRATRIAVAPIIHTSERSDSIVRVLFLCLFSFFLCSALLLRVVCPDMFVLVHPCAAGGAHVCEGKNTCEPWSQRAIAHRAMQLQGAVAAKGTVGQQDA